MTGYDCAYLLSALINNCFKYLHDTETKRISFKVYFKFS